MHARTLQDATFGEWEWRVNALRRFARRALSVCLLVALLVALVALLAWVVAWTEAQGVGLCLEFFPKLDADWMRHASLVQEGGGSRIVLGGMVFECHMRLQGALKFADWVRRRRGLAPLSGPISAVLAPVPWLFLGAVPGCPV